MIKRSWFISAVLFILSCALAYGEDIVVFQNTFVISQSHLKSDHTFDATNPGGAKLTVTKHYTGRLIKQGFLRLNGTQQEPALRHESDFQV